MARRRDLEARLGGIDGVVVSESMFGHGDAFWVNGKEIAHLEDGGYIEVRLTRNEIRERRADFKRDDRITLRPSGADWITVRVDTDADAAFAVDLVSIAAAAHRPPPGTAAAPPPTGAALRRRQRFH